MINPVVILNSLLHDTDIADSTLAMATRVLLAPETLTRDQLEENQDIDNWYYDESKFYVRQIIEAEIIPLIQQHINNKRYKVEEDEEDF